MESLSDDNVCKKLCIIFFLSVYFFFRVHILRHGRIPLWAKWTGSAEKAVAWISGCQSSTCPNDENVTAKSLREDLIICTSGVNPDGRITTQRSNSKVFQNVDEAREFWEKGKKNTTAVYQGMYLNEEKKKRNCSKGWIPSLGRRVLELHPAAEKRRGGTGRELNQKHVCAFQCDGGHCREGRYHVCVVKDPRGVGRARRKWKTVLRIRARPQELSTCSNTGPFMQFHMLELHCFCWSCCCQKWKKGKAAHPVKTFCVLLVPIATSEIVHLLQFKLFLTIFNCIYVSFFIVTFANLNTYVLLSIKTILFFGSRHACVLISGNFSEAELLSDL